MASKNSYEETQTATSMVIMSIVIKNSLGIKQTALESIVSNNSLEDTQTGPSMVL